MGDSFLVKVEDLTIGSHALVDIKCDCADCKNPYFPMSWKNYLKYLKPGNKSYCNKCAYKLFGTKKS